MEVIDVDESAPPLYDGTGFIGHPAGNFGC